MRYTIDDAVSLLMQAEPGDHATIRELQDVLVQLAADVAIPPDTRAMLAAAANAAGRDAFDDLRRLISAAARPPESEPEPVDAMLDASLIGDFITEGREYLDSAEAALLHLETNPEDTESINTVFRAFHTIKGTSGFLGLDAITSLAHQAESLLSRIRDREIRYGGHSAELALRSVDALKVLLDEVEAPPVPGGVPPFDCRDLLAALEHLDAPGAMAGDPAGSPLHVQPPVHDVAPAERRSDRAEASVRVRTERLDKLIDMIGELVIAHSMIAEDETLRSTAMHELARKVSHAGKIVRELQDLSMGMRMVPLKGPFQKVTRLARDLAHRWSKQVDVVLDGEDTEIDRNLVDVLSDPLVHMVRNAVDHGLEGPDERLAAGKPAAGRLAIAAYHAGGNVVVEIRDDGRGLNRDKILAKAIASGIVAAGLPISDREIYDLIFAPGFSTADVVTDISGRGVGMDVVRRNVEAMRGRIEIDSRPGQGTQFIIRLPLTLAITDGMLVRVGTERYIVPTVNIQVSFRPEPAARFTVAGRGEMVTLRGDVLPLVRLHRVFGIAGAEEDPSRALLMVVGDGAKRAALLVDELLGQQQLVAKSLGEGVGRVPGTSGGAILGDGRVGLILDVREILDIARGKGQRDVLGPAARVA
ncbi:MAG TPA: chemotaxis protein CheA [Gemmatimonadaceae bacterium]|nr:chemotaxis protein CheA [Gemmatimonadaceae bacterium]